MTNDRVLHTRCAWSTSPSMETAPPAPLWTDIILHTEVVLLHRSSSGRAYRKGMEQPKPFGLFLLFFFVSSYVAASGFQLNSRTDSAHKAPITAIVYHPRDRSCPPFRRLSFAPLTVRADMVVSAAEDRKFKVWARVNRDKSREANSSATPDCTVLRDFCLFFCSHVARRFLAVPKRRHVP